MNMPTVAAIEHLNLDVIPNTGRAVCGMCPHEIEAHDRISLRYCAATAAGAKTRGCVCPTS
jgi:hypothetical protein